MDPLWSLQACVFEMKRLSQRKPQSQNGGCCLLAHRCQKSSECQEKLQEENRELRPGSNLSPGQGKVNTDFMESFGSWEYKRST